MFLEEEEEKEKEILDDALLDGLVEEVVLDDELLDESGVPIPIPEAIKEIDEFADDKELLDGDLEEDEEVDDYDSFDDHDEL